MIWWPWGLTRSELGVTGGVLTAADDEALPLSPQASLNRRGQWLSAPWCRDLGAGHCPS